MRPQKLTAILNAEKSKEMRFANQNIKHEALIRSKSQGVIAKGSEVHRTSTTEHKSVYIDDSLTFFVTYLRFNLSLLYSV